MFNIFILNTFINTYFLIKFPLLPIMLIESEKIQIKMIVLYGSIIQYHIYVNNNVYLLSYERLKNSLNLSLFIKLTVI